ncbi:MAG: hypothetical protein LBR90_01020, partial [Elusimicrobiota bacterium]|nr:hypothetical protein [Elusimicrobiota bacterium]
MLNIEKTEDIKEFIGLPFKLYKGNPYYVPELKMETKALFAKDPFWQNARRQFFIAKQDGEAVGRAAAIINKTHNDYWGDKTGFFGFFECADNRAAAAALLDAAGAWLKEGFKKLG